MVELRNLNIFTKNNFMIKTTMTEIIIVVAILLFIEILYTIGRILKTESDIKLKTLALIEDCLIYIVLVFSIMLISIKYFQ